jgi:hypothetical protein
MGLSLGGGGGILSFWVLDSLSDLEAFMDFWV